ncbi:hypothetical protein PO124_18815 [Bacillus licheniformis]|nr:hypothetical protein [Bacillus licheniformis]
MVSRNCYHRNLAVIGYFTVRHLEPEYAYMPPKEKSSQRKRLHGYDLWGHLHRISPRPQGREL